MLLTLAVKHMDCQYYLSRLNRLGKRTNNFLWALYSQALVVEWTWQVGQIIMQAQRLTDTTMHLQERVAH